MKKIWNINFLLPVLALYVGGPLILFLEDSLGCIKWSLFGSICFFASWWVLGYYDGTLRSALKWILRYDVCGVPLFLMFYAMVLLGKMDVLILFSQTLLCLLLNAASGLIAFGLRKKTGNCQLAFVVILILYLSLYPDRNSLFGTIFQGWI